MGGTKKKIGKQRRDKAYWSAKEIGYRSRASFKLLQINREFEFLQKSTKCIDLCAAPGSWMQVAKANMKMNSIVIGVDLSPIKPMPGCITLQGDITTEKCRSDLKKELHGAKVDLVLHDGAPNVGKSWVHDAYQQNLLTHHAFKLATEFLCKKGTFVTKVFRSKDYDKLHYVFNCLFEKVITKKPQASRAESAEIFVVCLRYKAPDKIDPRFLSAKDVFAEVEETQEELEQKVRAQGSKTKKVPAEGYEEGQLYKEIAASEFVRCHKIEFNLEHYYRIVLDEDWIINHPKTTDDIRVHCEDIKVLGSKEKRELKKWRERLAIDLKKKEKEEKGGTEENDNEAKQESEGDEEDKELESLDKQIENLQEHERKAARRLKKRALKEKRKKADRIDLKMIIPGDEGPTLQEEGLFQMKDLKTISDLDKMNNPDEDTESDEDEDEKKVKKPKTAKYSKEKGKLDKMGLYYKESDSEEEATDYESDTVVGDLGFEDFSKKKKKNLKRKVVYEEIEEEDPKTANPLLLDLDNSSRESKKQRKADLFFQRDIFQDLEKTNANDDEGDGEGDDSSDDEKKEDCEEDSDFDVEESYRDKKKQVVKETEGFAVVPKSVVPAKKKRNIVLTPEELALGQEMIMSKKRKREIMDRGWNRYMFNDRDEDLPDWFVKEEEYHMRPHQELDEATVEKYKNQQKDLNVRTIKKVAEAKARKKRKMVKKMDKAKKKAVSLLGNPDLGSREKANEIKKLYQRAAKTPKKEVKYVVAKKHDASKRAKRPAGVKGLYKQVDPRMKKDNAKKRDVATVKRNMKRRLKGKKTRPTRA